MKKRTIPREFKTFYLTFWVKDKQIKKESFDYGSSFGTGIFPAIPTEQGFYGRWDSDEVSNLKFDKEIHAVYEKTVTTLSSEQSYTNPNPKFLVEVDFTDLDRLFVNLLGMGKGYFTDRKDILHSMIEREKSNIFKKMDLEKAEHWKLTIPEDKSGTYVIRLHSMKKEGKNTVVYVRDGTYWKKEIPKVIGSYLVITVNSNKPEVLVLPTKWNLIMIPIGICMMAVMILFFLKKKSK